MAQLSFHKFVNSCPNFLSLMRIGGKKLMAAVAIGLLDNEDYALKKEEEIVKIHEVAARRDKNLAVNLEKLTQINNDARTFKAEKATEVKSQEAQGDLKVHSQEVKQSEIDEKLKGDTAVVDHGSTLAKKELQETTKHQIKEAHVDHRTNMFNLLEKHLGRMTEKTQKLQGAADNAQTAGNKNATVAEQAEQSVKELKTTMERVIKAYANLHKTLDNYDLQNAKGDIDANKAQEIQKAMLELAVAKGTLETQIEQSPISNATSKAQLKTEISQEFQKENKKFDKWSAKEAKGMMVKVSEVAKEELSKAQVNEATTTKADPLIKYHEKVISDLAGKTQQHFKAELKNSKNDDVEPSNQLKI
jgi:hypothetical protein